MYGDTAESIINKLGELTSREESKTTTTLNYVIEKAEANEYKLIHSNDRSYDVASSYVISMNIDKEIGMSFMMVADYRYAMFSGE